MGRDKALLPVEGAAMAARVAAALRAAGAAEVLAVGGDEPRLRALGLDAHPDEHPGGGPLPATITALRTARSELVLVAACDLLHPSGAAIAATVAALAGHPEALGAVPVIDGHRQWVHAAWRRAPAIAALAGAWEQGDRSLRRAAATMPLVDVPDIAPAALVDADEPADLP
jgi:molybdopterin-guanine dinucleotide biosynthesis protein A